MNDASKVEQQPNLARNLMGAVMGGVEKLFTAKLLFWIVLIVWLGFDLGTKSWAETATTRVVELTSERDLRYYSYDAEGELSPELLIDFQPDQLTSQKQRYPKVINEPAADLQPAADSLVWMEDADRAEPDGVEFIPGFLHFQWAENYGAAFSMGDGNTVLLALISIGVLGVLFYYVARIPKKRWFTLLCLGLISGGAIGNLYDRLTHDTVHRPLKYEARAWRDYAQLSWAARQRSPMPQDLALVDDSEATTAVRDFLYWPFEIPVYSNWWLEEGQAPRKWPVFNVADVGIVGGVIGLMIVMLLTPDPTKRRREDEEAGNADAASDADQHQGDAEAKAKAEA